MLLLVTMPLAARGREADSTRGARLARPTGAMAALCAVALAAALAGCDGGSSHYGGGYFETAAFGGDVLAGAPGEPIVDTFRQEAGGIRWDEDFDRLRLVEIFISANHDLDFVDEIEVEAQDRTLFGGGRFDTIGRFTGPPPPGVRSVVLHLRKDILDAYVSSGGRIELKLRVTGVAPSETVALFGSLTVLVEPRD